MTNMKSNNVIFFHVAIMGYGEQIANEVLDQIIKGDIYNYIDKIYIGVVGGNYNYNDPKIEYLYKNLSTSLCEFKTLGMLREFCINNPNNKVLYINTLGATAQTPFIKECKDKWREYYLYFAIEKYRECLKILNDYDTCGAEFVNEPVNHYSGNIWWATSNYVSNLVEVNNVVSPLTERHKCEFWIGTGKNAKNYSMFNSGISPYERHLHIFSRSNYVKELINEKY